MNKFDALVKKILPGGLSRKSPDNKVDPKELKKGIKDEYEEHFRDPKEKDPNKIGIEKAMAKKTAKDHLVQPGKSKYYTKLDKAGL